MIQAKLVVKAAEPIGTISPNVYGYFFENCGESIYPGVWAPEDSSLPNEDGLRTDVLEALARLGPSAARWPGGWYADFHHWEDGVGPREKRPISLIPNKWDREKKKYGSSEPNHFGTDEYIRFCRLIGAEPYICANMITGTARDAFHWVEYCNFDGDTSYTRLRAENGHLEPYNVKYWNLGNENQCPPEDYAQDFLRYADAMKRADGSIELVASASWTGGSSIAWNRRVIEHLRDFISRIDHLSFHYYVGSGFTSDFSEDQYYEQLATTRVLEELIGSTIRIADEVCGGKKRMGVVIDEWGRGGDGGEAMFTQLNTFRESMLSAASFNTFQKYADRVIMANVSHMINVGHCLLYANEETMFVTPNYYVWDMYRPHKGGTSLAVKEDSPIVKERAILSRDSHTDTVPEDVVNKPLRALSASASVSADRSRLTVTFLNQSLADDMELEVELHDGGTMGDGTLTVFVSDDVRDMNTFDNPQTVKPPVSCPVEADGSRMTVTAPAHSINAIVMNLLPGSQSSVHHFPL